MAQNTYQYSQGKNWGIVKKYWTRRLKPSRANSNPVAPYLTPENIDGSSSFVASSILFLLDRVHSLYAAVLDRYCTALAPLASWHLQCYPSFTWKRYSVVSQGPHAFFSGPSFRECPSIHFLASEAFLNCRGNFHNPLIHVSFMTLKLQLYVRHYQVRKVLPPTTTFTVASLCCYKPFLFTSWKLSELGVLLWEYSFL